MNLCTCGKSLTGKQKKYCSKSCQHLGAKHQRSIYIELVCEFCEKSYMVSQSKSNKIGKKYCSRKCKDTHQREIYIGKGNPIFGKQHSENWKTEASTRMKNEWKYGDIREKHRVGLERYIEKFGHSPGTDVDSTTKRRLTLNRNYGVNHIWESKEYRKKCEKTCLARYGKKSWEMAQDALRSNGETKPERMFREILEKKSIDYIQYYKIKVGCGYREYDFFIVDKNLLVEVDGDYWHGNGDIFDTLNEAQLKNLNNDTFKNGLAFEHGYDILRIWESEILSGSLEKFYEKIQD